MVNNKNKLSLEQVKEQLKISKDRFERNMIYHNNLDWSDIKKRLESNIKKLYSLHEMERTGGEPDLINYDLKTDEYVFYDFSKESPIGRRNVCYDRKGQELRKQNKPDDNAVDMAAAMGIKLLTEKEYRELQKLDEFDTKTSSWIKTPPDIRELGGALFCDRRYGKVFVYHNSAQSYYSVRGFRGSLRV